MATPHTKLQGGVANIIKMLTHIMHINHLKVTYFVHAKDSVLCFQHC